MQHPSSLTNNKGTGLVHNIHKMIQFYVKRSYIIFVGGSNRLLHVHSWIPMHWICFDLLILKVKESIGLHIIIIKKQISLLNVLCMNMTHNEGLLEICLIKQPKTHAIIKSQAEQRKSVEI